MKKFLLASSLVVLLCGLCLPLQKIHAEDGKDTMNASISLSYLPMSPLNDLEGKDGDEITISSYISSTVAADDLKYDWLVYSSTEKQDPSEWDDVPKKDLVDVSDMSGYGVKELKFKLNFKDEDIHFIRVKLKIEEVTQMGDKNTGWNDIVIPLISSSGKITAYSVSAEDTKISMGDRICKDATIENPCAVTKNDIVGVKLDSSKFSDFSWTLDGKPLTYAECPLSNCNSNEAFFPVLKDAQETYTVEVAATQDETDQRIHLSQTFVVTEPSAFIVSTDKTTCAPVLKGYFKDLDDNLTPDYSASEFEAIAGSTIKLDPSFDPQDINEVYWTIDASEMTKETASQYGLTADGKDYGIVINDDGSISFPADTQVGYSFDVKFSTLYTPSKSIKKALNKYWGVGLGDFYEKQIDATINITIVDSFEAASNEIGSSATKNKKNGTLAALAANAPSHLIFLVKLVLISIVLLFASYFLLSLFPKKNNDQ